MSEWASIREALNSRPGRRGMEMFNGIPVIVSPALPSYPTWMTDLTRYVRHALKLKSPEALRTYDPGPLPGDPIHAVQAGSKIIVSQDMYDSLKAMDL